MADSDSGTHVTDISEVNSQEGDFDLRREGKVLESLECIHKILNCIDNNSSHNVKYLN